MNQKNNFFPSIYRVRDGSLHVKHAVSLVQHQIGHAAQVSDTAFQVIDQSPGSGNDDFDTTPSRK